VTDRIAIRGLRVFARHGVLPEERSEGQVFVIDVVVETDLSAAGRSDDLADTVDYAALASQVATTVETERWDLLERVAARVADVALAVDGVEAVEVTVRKPDARLEVEFDDVSVTISRSR
jgi:dihydroneopterin aldolase